MITSCQVCGLIVDVELVDGAKSVCPRCSCILIKQNRNMSKVFFYSLTALILSLPAVTFPFLKVYINSELSTVTLLEVIVTMFRDGLDIAAFIILMTAVVFPVTYLSLMVYVSMSCFFKGYLPYVWKAVRGIQIINYFQMTGVFIIGILVTIVKMVDIADVYMDVGFFCLLGMSLLLVLAREFYDEHILWCKDERKY